MTRLLSIKEFGAAIGVSRSVVYEHVAAGRIASVRIGRFTRIPDSEVDRVAAEGLPTARGQDAQPAFAGR
jgi:excisionase family DNA binding protein